jgi:flagellar biosynthesis protein FlhG
VSLADEVLVVATPEPTSLTDAYATLKVLALQQGRHRSLLAGQPGAQKPGDGRTVAQQLQTGARPLRAPSRTANASSWTYLGEIPADSAVRDAVQRRQLLMLSYPGSTAAQAILAVARRLAEPAA